MNYLGHLYFSNNDLELMYANLFGDFVKGKNYTQYSEKVQFGVHLHRTIDDYIDNHPAVLELLHKLYEPLPKVAGIAIDLMFDHLLAKNWNDYHDVPLEEFLDNFHMYDINLDQYDKPQFSFVVDKMREHKWMYHYKTTFGLTKACEGLSKRISFPNVLHKGAQVFEIHEANIEKTFREFMDDAIPFYASYFEKRQSNLG